MRGQAVVVENRQIAEVKTLLWGRHNFIEERTVDVHIRRLRKVLADFGREHMIQTVRGRGYSLRAGA